MTDVLGALRARTTEMVDSTAMLVDHESPSVDLEATARCASAVADLGHRLLGAHPEHEVVDGRTHLRWRFGEPRVGLIGHVDTVWPAGTLARWPFAVTDGVATGPGAFDMKAGIVQGFFALDTLDDLDGVEIVLNSDEEIGSPTSRHLFEDLGRRVAAVLVLEPSAGAALKTARKGVSLYRIDIEGLASHAGLEPEKGVNALEELAHVVLALRDLGNASTGTTVTPTVARAGTVTNVVPAAASVDIDVRAMTVAEQTRVDDQIRALAATVPGAALSVTGGPNRPPLEPASSADLYARAQAAAARIGIPEPGEVHVGGGSDGNFTAGVGTPTLDGLGAVGGGAHAEGEHFVVAAMAERAALVAALVDELRR